MKKVVVSVERKKRAPPVTHNKHKKTYNVGSDDEKDYMDNEEQREEKDDDFDILSAKDAIESGQLFCIDDASYSNNEEENKFKTLKRESTEVGLTMMPKIKCHL
eukprot:7464702-Ditylum_brightwellii.AAC.1